jgi:hypothetical protein
VRGILHIGPGLEALRSVLAGLVAINLRGNHHVADHHILDAAGDAYEERDVRVVVLDGTNGDRGCSGIAGACLHHRDVPAVEAPSEKTRAVDGFDRVLAQLPQHRASLCFERGDDDNSGR